MSRIVALADSWKLLLALCALLFISLALYPAVAAAAAPDKGLGVNLHGIRYWSPALPFADAFKQAGPWIPQRAGSQAWDTGEPLEIGSDGWVRSLSQGQQAATVVLQGGTYPAGQYRVTYEGQGEIAMGLDARIVDRQGNDLTVMVKPQNSVILKVMRTDPVDPVRNIRVMLPGFDPIKHARHFNPAYLEYLRGFKVLRFMDWANTNLNDTGAWEMRTRTEHASQDRKTGVALEYMIQMAGELNAHPWFNIPHAADDAYVRQMAMLIKSRMQQDAKLYVEYSNEVWNRQFPQHAHAMREAARLGLKDADEYYVRRSLETFRIFEEVFGGSERLVRVLSGQAVNVFRAGRMLARPDIGKRVDAYAIAPYFGHSGQLPMGEGDPGAVPIDRLMGRLADANAETREVIRANAALAKKAGLHLIAYEAGQHVTNPPGQDGYCAAINRHPAMADLYGRYLDIWSEETDGSLMVLFSDMSRYGRSGCWGLSEFHGQDLRSAPKLRAVRAKLGNAGLAR